MQYAAERAAGRAKQSLLQLANLVTDLKRLPEWGFPEIAGFSGMPVAMFAEASEMGSKFVDLVVQCMLQLGWDSSWWSECFPNAFAALLHSDTEKAPRLVRVIDLPIGCQSVRCSFSYLS